MVMNLGGAALILLMTMPVLGSALCLTLRRYITIKVVIATVSAILVAISFYLALSFLIGGVDTIQLSSSDIAPLSWGIIIFSYVLIAAFFYIGYRIKSWPVIIFALVELIATSIIEVQNQAHDATPTILIDNLSLILSLITSIIGSIITIYALKYMEGEERRPQFFAAVLLFLGAMNGAVFSNDMVWFLFFWEVTTLCSFLLIGHRKTEEASKAAKKAIEYTLGGGAALSIGIFMAYQFAGTLSLDALHNGGITSILLLMLGIFILGALTKSAQVPFQSWLTGAMVAPTPVSALLHSSTMVNLGVYLLLRLSPAIHGVQSLTFIIGLIGAASFVTSSILAIAQSSAKKLLAYSTIGNLGLITMCVGVDTPLAITAALILLFYHAISKALLFLVVGVIMKETNSDNIDSMTALRDRMPFTTLALAVGVFTVVLPPFGMFFSKLLISEAIVSFPILAFLLGAGLAATTVFYAKWLGVTISSSFFEAPRIGEERLPRLYRYPLGALMVGAIISSILIGAFITYLFNPFTQRIFSSSVPSDAVSIFSSFSDFPVFAVLLVMGVLLVTAAFLLRPGSKEATTPYMCGEEFPVETGGIYYFSDATQLKVNRAAEWMGATLILLLILIPTVLEAML